MSGRSAGVRPGELDPFAVAVMDEIGIDIARHHPHSFEDLEDAYFDLVISLAPEAQHRAVELTRATATELEFWASSLARYAQFAVVAEQPEVDCLVAASVAGRATTFTGECEPAPGIRMIEVGGHTPGQAIVVVDVGAGRTIVLASDASHYYVPHSSRWPPRPPIRCG